MNACIYIGKFCIEPCERDDGDGVSWLWISHEGEGGQFKEAELEAVIAEFFNEHF